MSIATPTAPQRCLQGPERQAFALHVEGDGREQPGQPIFQSPLTRR